MKLHTGYRAPLPRLHAATAKDDGRYALNSISVEREPGSPTATCIATDGRILAVVEVEAHEDDASGLVAPKAWEAACKVKRARRDLGSDFHALIANGSCKVTGGGETREFPRPEGSFPAWRAVLPTKGQGTVRVGFDVELLSRLADALGAACVSLEIQVGKDGYALKGAPIRVEPIRDGGGPESYGAIMPVTVS